MTETAEKVDLSKATSRPWKIIPGVYDTNPETANEFPHGPEIVGVNGEHVASFDLFGEANAALIVRAVNERDELIQALEFYRDGFKAKVPKKPRYPGDISSITYKPTEALLDDCGNRALSILAKVGE